MRRSGAVVEVAVEEAPAFFVVCADAETATARQAQQGDIAVAAVAVSHAQTGGDRPVRFGQPEPHTDVGRIGRDHDLFGLELRSGRSGDEFASILKREVLAEPEDL